MALHDATTEELLASGPRYDPTWYVHRGAEESRALKCLSAPGSPAILQGPQLYGKSTLLAYLTEMLRCDESGIERTRIVSLRLPTLMDDGEPSLDHLLRTMGRALMTRVGAAGVDEALETAWARPGSPKNKMRWLLERHILSEEQPLVLALEDVDRLEGMPFQTDFFAMLRSWVEMRQSPWQSLRLVVTVATEPTLLERSNASLFSGAHAAIQLGDLQERQVGELAARCDLRLDEPDLRHLRQLTGGHPYLVRLALYEATERGMPVRELLEGVESNGGLFRPYLHQLRVWLEHSHLLGSIAAILKDPRVSLSREDYARLYSRGLVVEVAPGEYRLRCDLYESFFREQCGT